MLRVRLCGDVVVEAHGRTLLGTLLAGRQGRLTRTLGATPRMRCTAYFNGEGAEYAALRGSLLQNRPALLAHGWDEVRAQLAPDFVHQRGIVNRAAASGTLPDAGGEFRNEWICLTLVDDTGRIERIEFFDVEAEEAALARLEELLANEATAPPLVCTTATRAQERFVRLWQDGEWDSVEATFAPEFHGSDRRPLLAHEADVTSGLAQLRTIWASRAVAVRSAGHTGRPPRPLQTTINVPERDAGPAVIERITVTECTPEGLHLAVVNFDPEAVDAAYDELDRRCRAQPDAHGRPGILDLSGDWDRLAAVYRPCSAGHARP